MGCASSKQIRATTPLDVVYRPSPTSVSVFDINSVEEPWLKHQQPTEPPPPPSSELESNNNNMLVSYVPPPILEKLNSFEQLSTATTNAVPPRSWDEISKALHDDLNNKKKSQSQPAAVSNTQLKAIEAPPKAEEDNEDKSTAVGEKRRPRKSFSLHTLEELDNRVHSSSNSNSNKPQFRKTESVGSELNKKGTSDSDFTRTDAESESSQKLGIPKAVIKNSLRNNPFIQKDISERQKEGKSAALEKFLALRRDPLLNFPEKTPPNGSTSVVLYTTSLRGVRRTFENCTHLRTILETHRVVFDERDVSLHAEFLNELKDVLGVEEGASVSVPRMFVHGRYLGGAEEVVELNETGKLGRILSWARVERGVGRLGCDGCGGARFVPCFECAGSCKVVVEDGDGGSKKERCDKCNENGLIHCPLCH